MLSIELGGACPRFFNAQLGYWRRLPRKGKEMVAAIEPDIVIEIMERVARLVESGQSAYQAVHSVCVSLSDAEVLKLWQAKAQPMVYYGVWGKGLSQSRIAARSGMPYGHNPAPEGEAIEQWARLMDCYHAVLDEQGRWRQVKLGDMNAEDCRGVVRCHQLMAESNLAQAERFSRLGSVLGDRRVREISAAAFLRAWQGNGD